MSAIGWDRSFFAVTVIMITFVNTKKCHDYEISQ